MVVLLSCTLPPVAPPLVHKCTRGDTKSTDVALVTDALVPRENEIVTAIVRLINNLAPRRALICQIKSHPSTAPVDGNEIS